MTRSWQGLRQQFQHFGRRTGLSDEWEEPCDAVDVSVQAAVGHCIDGKGDIETMLIRLARRGLHTAAGGHPDDHDLGDAAALQIAVETQCRVAYVDHAARGLRLWSMM